jgi:hypothetical protein
VHPAEQQHEIGLRLRDGLEQLRVVRLAARIAAPHEPLVDP